MTYGIIDRYAAADKLSSAAWDLAKANLEAAGELEGLTVAQKRDLIEEELAEVLVQLTEEVVRRTAFTRGEG